MEEQQRSVDRKATSEGIPEFSQGISRASPKSRDLANTQDVCENTRMSKRTTTYVRVSYTDLLVGKPFGRGTCQSQLLPLTLFSTHSNHYTATGS